MQKEFVFMVEAEPKKILTYASKTIFLSLV